MKNSTVSHVTDSNTPAWLVEAIEAGEVTVVELDVDKVIAEARLQSTLDMICEFCCYAMDSASAATFYGDESFVYGHEGCGEAVDARQLIVKA